MYNIIYYKIQIHTLKELNIRYLQIDYLLNYIWLSLLLKYDPFNII